MAKRSRRMLARHGSVYIAVTGTALLISLIGFTSVHLSRLELRKASLQNDQTQARQLAQSGVEFALAAIDVDPNWRTNYTHGVESSRSPMSAPHPIYFRFLDNADGNLANDSTQPVEIQGIGRCGDAEFRYSVTYAASIDSAQQIAGPLHSYEGGWSTYENVGTNASRGQHFVATLPAGATSWSITQIEVFLSGSGGNGGTVNANLYLSDGGGTPATLLETVTVAESALPTAGNYNFYPFNFASVTGLTPGVGLSLVMEGVGDGSDARLPYNTSVSQSNSHFLRGGTGSWNTNASQSVQFRVHGVYSTSTGSGPFTISPGSWQRVAVP